MCKNITINISENLINNLKHDFKLPNNTSNEIVVKKAIATGMFTATSGVMNDNMIIINDQSLNLNKIF